MNIFITGATGFLGRQLVLKYLAEGHKVTILIHTTNPFIFYKPFNINNLKFIYDIASLPSAVSEKNKFDLIINLAGKSINSKWTENRKNSIYASRIKITSELVYYLKKVSIQPSLVISMSAVGYYAYSKNFQKQYDERTEVDSIENHDESFSHELCRSWEDNALQATAYNTRVVIFRLGLVLGREGGIMKKIAPIFKMGIPFTIGNGKQALNWVHIKDVMHACDFAYNYKEVKGVYNLTSPESSTNKEFSIALSSYYNKKLRFSIRPFILKMLFGQMAKELLLYGSKVFPYRLTNEKYKYTVSSKEPRPYESVNIPKPNLIPSTGTGAVKKNKSEKVTVKFKFQYSNLESAILNVLNNNK